MADDVKRRTFTIDDAECEVPEIASFDFDEMHLLYEYTRLSLEDFVPDQEDGEMSDERVSEIVAAMRNPGFLRTLMHVAYRRANPKVPEARIKQVIGRQPFAPMFAAWVAELEEDEAGPPAGKESTSDPDASSARNSDGSNGSSGEPSTRSSDEPAGPPESTGTYGSVMSFPHTRAGTSESYAHPI